MAQWIAHWTSRHVSRDIQRLWVRVPPESQARVCTLSCFQINTGTVFQIGLYQTRHEQKINHRSKKSLWRNRLARSAVNREDGGSSPLRDVMMEVSILSGLIVLGQQQSSGPTSAIVVPSISIL